VLPAGALTRQLGAAAVPESVPKLWVNNEPFILVGAIGVSSLHAGSWLPSFVGVRQVATSKHQL
jgi:hypothetical protein